MRLHAFLLVAVAALHARAATIPVSETEKKLIETIPENLEKKPENTSSEQELIDQANTIKDVENNLRNKPEDIPVEVIVEDAQPGLKADAEKDDSDEINRPTPDLRNPGPPQRQEHETQNPAYYSHEQEIFLNFKETINEAQSFLKQGFQGITDGIQNMLDSNAPIETIQKSIHSLRDGFTAQINKLNGTIQTALSTETSSNNQPPVEQTKASIYQIESGLISLRNDFNKGVKSLVDGVEIFASLRADNESSNPSSTSTSAPASPIISQGPIAMISQNFQQFQQSLQTAMSSLYTNAQNAFQGLAPSSTAVPAGVQSDSQVTSAPPAAPVNFWQSLPNPFNGILNPGQVQSDQPVTPRPPGQFGSGNGPFVQALNTITSFFTRPGGQAPQVAQPAAAAQPVSIAQPAQTEPKPSENAIKPETKPEPQPEPAKPAEAVQATAVTAAGPIRQILQNNPISQGIAGAVQRLQNVNNPEKPREEVVEEQKSEEVIKPEQDKTEEESKGGHHEGGHNGDNIERSDRLEENEAVKMDDTMPTVQKQDDVKEHKTEEVADKTE